MKSNEREREREEKKLWHWVGPQNYKQFKSPDMGIEQKINAIMKENNSELNDCAQLMKL